MVRYGVPGATTCASPRHLHPAHAAKTPMATPQGGGTGPRVCAQAVTCPALPWSTALEYANTRGHCRSTGRDAHRTWPEYGLAAASRGRQGQVSPGGSAGHKGPYATSGATVLPPPQPRRSIRSHRCCWCALLLAGHARGSRHVQGLATAADRARDACAATLATNSCLHPAAHTRRQADGSRARASESCARCRDPGWCSRRRAQFEITRLRELRPTKA